MQKDQFKETNKNIESAGFTLRPFNINDAKSAIRILNNENVIEKLGKNFPRPYTEESFNIFFEKIKNDTETTYFAIEKDENLVGGISIDLEDNNTAMFGYWLDEKYWGMGIITKAIEEVINYGIKKFSIKKFYADTLDSNVGSEKVLIKNSFVKEKDLDRFVKVI